MISARDVHVTFGRGTPLENRALHGLVLKVADGEFVALVGPWVIGQVVQEVTTGAAGGAGAVGVEAGGAGDGTGAGFPPTGVVVTGEVGVAGDAAVAESLGEALAVRCGGSLTELLYGVQGHLQQQVAILRAVSHLRAARLHLATAEPLARYQAALDNELYKAIRALREAQAHRRANAALEGVALATAA